MKFSKDEKSIIGYLFRQMAWSEQTFGPGNRDEGVADHIKKELVEILDATSAEEAAKEWVDVIILGLDGLWRVLVYDMKLSAYEAAQKACQMLNEKFLKNEQRKWPDWRKASPGKAIEHVRGEYD
jgi:hypothetical protein